jgi:hypothetical protein
VHALVRNIFKISGWLEDIQPASLEDDGEMNGLERLNDTDEYYRASYDPALISAPLNYHIYPLKVDSKSKYRFKYMHLFGAYGHFRDEKEIVRSQYHDMNDSFRV